MNSRKYRARGTRTIGQELLALWRLWLGLGLVALTIGVALTFVSCQSPRKPGHVHRPPRGKDAVAGSDASDGVGPSVAPPHPSRKDDSQQIYDPDRPCLTRGQARRASAVLFRNRNREDPEVWIQGLNEAFYDLKVDCSSDDFLLLAVTTIQMESNVRVDPPVGNANLEQLYSNRLKQFRRDHLLEAAALNVSGLDNQLRAKLRKDTRKGIVRTEADLDRYVAVDLRPWLLRTLQSDYHLPESLATVVVTRAVPDPVHTIGPMQVDFEKAYRNAIKRGESVPSVQMMKQWLLDPQTALQRGLKEGVYLLKLSYQAYRDRMEPEKAVLFSAADYNAGEFSSRNAAFQERVSILTGKKLVLDGDLLLYKDGVPEVERSQTEAGTQDLLSSEMTTRAIRRDLLLDKEPGFAESQTATAICEKFEKRRRMPCLPARLPVGAGNPTAEDKWGKILTPADYAYGYVKRYRANQAAYGEAAALDGGDPSPVASVPRGTSVSAPVPQAAPLPALPPIRGG